MKRPNTLAARTVRITSAKKLAALGSSAAFTLPSQANAGLFESAENKDGLPKTYYPVVLNHGLFGFEQMLGVDYRDQTPNALHRSKAAVHATQASAANSTELRGELPPEDVALTGRSKANLIGHSHGGPAFYCVAVVRPDLVTSPAIFRQRANRLKVSGL